MNAAVVASEAAPAVPNESTLPEATARRRIRGKSTRPALSSIPAIPVDVTVTSTLAHVRAARSSGALSSTAPLC